MASTEDHAHHHDHPAACAGKVRVKLDHDYSARLRDFLSGLVDDLSGRGYPLVGHLKLAAQDTAGSVFYASVTDLGTGPQVYGELQKPEDPITVRVNAILYFVEESTLRDIFEKHMAFLESS